MNLNRNTMRRYYNMLLAENRDGYNNILQPLSNLQLAQFNQGLRRAVGNKQNRLFIYKGKLYNAAISNNSNHLVNRNNLINSIGNRVMPYNHLPIRRIRPGKIHTRTKSPANIMKRKKNAALKIIKAYFNFANVRTEKAYGANRIRNKLEDPFSGYNFQSGNQAWAIFGKNARGKRVNPMFLTNNSLSGLQQMAKQKGLPNGYIQNPLTQERLNVSHIPWVVMS